MTCKDVPDADKILKLSLILSLLKTLQTHSYICRLFACQYVWNYFAFVCAMNSCLGCALALTYVSSKVSCIKCLMVVFI